jgi:hypothetical protein
MTFSGIRIEIRHIRDAGKVRGSCGVFRFQPLRLIEDNFMLLPLHDPCDHY